MAVNKVELYVSQILEDLDNGLTWLKRDDLGYGSIQDKYNAKDQQIVMIRKHPKLKDAETNVIVFTVIDDTDGGTTPTTASATNTSNEQHLGSIPETSELKSGGPTELPEVSNDSVTERDGHVSEEPVTANESADAFFNI